MSQSSEAMIFVLCMAVLVGAAIVLTLTSFVRMSEYSEVSKDLLIRQYPKTMVCRVVNTDQKVMVLDHSIERVKVMYLETNDTQWLEPYEFLVGCKR